MIWRICEESIKLRPGKNPITQKVGIHAHLTRGRLISWSDRRFSFLKDFRMHSSLKVYNTFTRNKDEFIPGKNNTVSWYCCGPTVYNKSHLGHARTYLSFDIIRRIMRDYLGYNLLYIMNITDIDDKIIKGARYGYLFNEFLLQNKFLSKDVIREASQALEFYIKDKIEPILSKTGVEREELMKNWRDYMLETVDIGIGELRMKAMTKAHNAISALGSLESDSQTPSEEFLLEIEDVLCPFLDSKSGHKITDNKIFTDFAHKWELDFWKDMESLNVEPPDVLVRVTQYIPEVVDFIKGIINNGYGYELDGSIYFDIQAFNSSPNHIYAKLEPQARKNYALLSEAEGDLHVSGKDKKNPGDFVLWKKSREGEPSWDSPWSKGRPGWHIECSTMASDVAGETLDVHSGGIDLTFPHHDNELAQSEAYYKCKNWVRYFLHTGHLNIGGMKMSKSLKNFITVEDALKTVSSTRLRIMFLLSSWNKVFDYKAERFEEAKFYESLINNFLSRCNAIISKSKPGYSDGKFKGKEFELHKFLADKKCSIHECLCDSFDTPSVMLHLRELIEKTNSYIGDKEKSSYPLNITILKLISTYIKNIMTVFGVSYGDPKIEDKSQLGECFAKFSEFRDNVRNLAKNKSPYADLFLECDRVRDEVFPEFGIQLDDNDSGSALVKMIGREAAMEAVKVNKLARCNSKSKETAVINKTESKAAISPLVMFKSEEFKQIYSLWDENGIPTTLKDGSPISKSQRKKLEKKYALQKKLYEENAQK